MAEVAGEISLDAGKDTPQISKQEIISRLKDPVELVAQVGDLPLKTISGFDEGKGVNRKNFHYVFIDDNLVKMGVVFKDESGETVPYGIPQTLFPLEEVKTLSVGGKEYRVRSDPWENVILTKVEKTAINPESQQTLAKVLQLWKAAIEGKDVFKDYLQQNIDPQTLTEINEVIAYLKVHPVFRKASLAGKIDPWELSKVATIEDRQKIMDRISYGFSDTQEFKDVMSLVEKIRDKKPFEKDEIVLLNALACSDRVTRITIHSIGDFRITPLNERYVIANLTENYLMRSLVPQETFLAHDRHYKDFVQFLQEHKVEVPDWFSPYSGQEFDYGPAVGRTIANAGGKFFFSIFGETKDAMAGILDHERIHNLADTARCQAKEYPKNIGFGSEEVSIESLAELIMSGGNVQEALSSLSLERTYYCNGVRRLLNILDEINESAGDKNLGTILLFKGLAGLATGEEKGFLNAIEKYYDEKDVGKGVKFAEKMAAFSDKRRLYFWEEPAPKDDLPKSEISRVLSSLTYQEAIAIDPHEKEDWFKKDIVRYSEHPLDLIGSSILSKTKELLFDRVMADQKAVKELQVFVDDYYRSYYEMIKKQINEDLSKGKTSVIAGTTTS